VLSADAQGPQAERVVKQIVPPGVSVRIVAGSERQRRDVVIRVRPGIAVEVEVAEPPGAPQDLRIVP
jgi:hypothetical protein